MKKKNLPGVYEKVTVTMTPSEAMMKIHGVVNKMPYPEIFPMVELCERIAFALGFKCNPFKTQ